MVGGLTSAEFARLLSRHLDSRANRVHFCKLPGRSIPTKAGDDVGTSKKRKRAVAKARRWEGKAPAVEATVSDVTLTAPHFIPADFATRPEITPLVDGVCQVIVPTEGLGLLIEMNEFGESCTAVESLFVWGLAVHMSAKKSVLERLDGYWLRQRKAEDDLCHKEDERRVVADTLRRPNAENRSLRADLEASNRWGAERDCQLAAAEERIKSLETRLVSAEAAASTLGPATESAKQACYTLRLALNDLGARAEDAPGDDGMAFDFSEWMQEAAGSVVEVASAYGDCSARVSAGFVLSLLHTHSCEHIRDFPGYVMEEWPSNSQCSEAALKAFRKGFWEDGGQDCAKTHLRENLERIAKEEEAAAVHAGGDPGSAEPAAEHEGEGNRGQNYPEVLVTYLCMCSNASTLTPSRSSSDTSRPSSPPENITLCELAPSSVGVIASSP
uniref:B1292H11.9 protein n=1 Tax=Oryza sativa subsp. japonica TaxID=39947 RepID=Q6MWC2_ORYSJ|nr:B1292H11.9 [Oryza sativa Japonica Group]